MQTSKRAYRLGFWLGRDMTVADDEPDHDPGKREHSNNPEWRITGNTDAYGQTFPQKLL